MGKVSTRIILFTSLLHIANTGYSQQYSLTDSLIAVYKFEGNALDSTSNHNDGIVHGATLTTDRFGNPNGAYNFNGASDYIELIPGNSKFKPTTFPISVCAWIKYNGPSNGQLQKGVSCVFVNDLKENEYYGVWLTFSLNGQISINYGTGGASGPSYRRTKNGITNISDNKWHFIAGIIRGTVDMDLYVDCKNDGGVYSGIGGSLTYSNNYGSVAKSDLCSTGCDPFYYYKGVIDEIRFYHRELTQDDIYRLYKMSPFPFPSVSLGADVGFCNLSSLALTPAYSNANSFIWSNGKTTSAITVTSSGKYSITVSDSKGCKAWDTVKVNSTGGIFSGILSALRDTICSGTPAMLSVTSNSGNINWQSSLFPNKQFASVSGASNDSYTDFPAQTAYYRVVASGGGCSDTSTPYKIVVKPSPVAGYTYGGTGLNLDFNSGESSGDVTVWEWSFGDGGTSDLPNPSHSYIAKDTFQACLTVYNGSNCSFTICKYIDLFTGVVNENMKKYSLIIFPNPMYDYTNLSVTGTTNEKYELSITNVLGQQVKCLKGKTGSNMRIGREYLFPGMYIYELIINREVVGIGKLVVN